MLLPSHTAETVTWQLILPHPLQMFPFMARIFISLCLQSLHRWKVSERGGHRFTSGETSCVYPHFALQASVAGAHHSGCSGDSLGIILARSGCRACLVAGTQMSLWLSIFSLPRVPISYDIESCSHLTWLSLLAAGCCAWSHQGLWRRGSHMSRQYWRPLGLCPSCSQSHSF